MLFRSEFDNIIEKEIKTQLYKTVHKTFAQDLKPKGAEENAWDAIMSRKKVLILGKPGAGKTTFQKHILLRSLLDGNSEHRIPIYIPLRDVSNVKEHDIFAFMGNEFSNGVFDES